MQRYMQIYRTNSNETSENIKSIVRPLHREESQVWTEFNWTPIVLRAIIQHSHLSFLSGRRILLDFIVRWEVWDQFRTMFLDLYKNLRIMLDGSLLQFCTSNGMSESTHEWWVSLLIVKRCTLNSKHKPVLFVCLLIASVKAVIQFSKPFQTSYIKECYWSTEFRQFYFRPHRCQYSKFALHTTHTVLLGNWVKRSIKIAEL